MYLEIYEQMVHFASQGELANELALAREEYVRRTGDLFESDESYERRLGSYLEWYVFDRPVSFGAGHTPARLYVDTQADKLKSPELATLRELNRTKLSLFEYRGAKPEAMRVKDLLSNEKQEVFERRQTAGLVSGDILEARLVPNGDRLLFSPALAVHPPQAKKAIQRAAKRFRKQKGAEGHIDLVHRVAFLANRCDRYAHVDPREIFAELES